MTRAAFEELVAARPWLLADGATGTGLFDRGLMSGDAPELWNEQHPERIEDLERRAELGLAELADFSGHPARIVEQYGQGGPNETARLIDPNSADAPTLSFTERVVDENGRMTREHRGHYRLDNRDPVAATPGSVEFVDGPQPWPPATVPPGAGG